MKGDNFLKMRGIKKSFGDQVVLRGVDLDVRRGEVLVLLGGSGGGKSVLMKHMVGLLQPDEGTVTLEGKVISDLSERELSWARKKISIMFQGGALFDSMTVAENIAFPMQEAGVRDRDELFRRVSEALKKKKIKMGKEIYFIGAKEVLLLAEWEIPVFHPLKKSILTE